MYCQLWYQKFTEKVNNILKKDNKVIIIDCHSFPKYPLPYELNQVRERAEICIGTDEFHTPNLLKDD